MGLQEQAIDIFRQLGSVLNPKDMATNASMGLGCFRVPEALVAPIPMYL
jgi:hypothetical protein